MNTYQLRFFFTACLALLLLLPFFVSCEKAEQRQTVPLAQVHFRVDVNGIDHTLRNPLSYKTFTDRRVETDRVGFGGLLLVSCTTGKTIFAYDLACPHEADRNIRVTPNSDGFAVCASCGSEFVLMYGLGTVKSGPARKTLQRYHVIEQSSGIFLVRN